MVISVRFFIQGFGPLQRKPFRHFELALTGSKQTRRVPVWSTRALRQLPGNDAQLTLERRVTANPE
jgi:hypothetical protein